MDCSCDLKDLKKLLQNDKEAKKYKWSVLEDLALLSEQDTGKDPEVINKRRKFLEYDKRN